MQARAVSSDTTDHHVKIFADQGHKEGGTLDSSLASEPPEPLMIYFVMHHCSTPRSLMIWVW